jgi:hypothetical protein
MAFVAHSCREVIAVRRNLVVCVILLMFLPMWAFGSGVLVVLPPSFHCVEVNETVRQLKQYDFSIVVAAVDTLNPCLTALPPVVEVKPLTDSDVSGYGAIVFEGYGWYSDWFYPVYQGQPAPDFAPVVSDLVKNAIDYGVPLAMAGPGGYVYLMSGAAIPGSDLSVYDCEEYYGYCDQLGVTPVIAKGDPPAGSPHYGPDAQLVIDDAKGTPLISTSIPTTWYGDNLVVGHYQKAYDDFFSSVADAVAAGPPQATLPLMAQNVDHLTVVNVGPTQVDLRIDSPFGEDVQQTVESTIGPGAAAAYEMGPSQFPGSVVVTASQEVAVIANMTVDTSVDATTSYQGIPMGSDVMQAPAARSTFPGCRTDGNFEGWLWFGNPNSISTDVAVTYWTEDQTTYGSTLHLSPQETHAVRVNDAVGEQRHFSVVVESTSPILVARQVQSPWEDLWIRDVDFAIPEPSAEWWLPCGRTDSDEYGAFETNVILQTIGRQMPKVTVEFQTLDGGTSQTTETLPQDGTIVIDVGDLVGQDPMIGIHVTADAPIYAERELTWTQHGTGRSIVDITRGVGEPSTHWNRPVRRDKEGLELINPGYEIAHANVIYWSGPEEFLRETMDLHMHSTMRITPPAGVDLSGQPGVVSITSDVPIVVRNAETFTVRGTDGMPLTFEFDTSPVTAGLSQTWYVASTFSEDMADAVAAAVASAPFSGAEGAVEDEFDTLNHLMDQALAAVDGDGITRDQAEAVLREMEVSFEALQANMPDIFGVPFATWFAYLSRMQSAFDYGWESWSQESFAWFIDDAQRAKELLERFLWGAE